MALRGRAEVLSAGVLGVRHLRDDELEFAVPDRGSDSGRGRVRRLAAARGGIRRSRGRRPAAAAAGSDTDDDDGDKRDADDAGTDQAAVTHAVALPWRRSLRVAGWRVTRWRVTRRVAGLRVAGLRVARLRGSKLRGGSGQRGNRLR